MGKEDGGALLESGKLSAWVEEVLPEIVADNDDAKEAVSDLVTFIEALIETEKLTATSSVDDIANAKPKFEAEIVEILDSKTEQFVTRLAKFLTDEVQARAAKRAPAGPAAAQSALKSSADTHVTTPAPYQAPQQQPSRGRGRARGGARGGASNGGFAPHPVAHGLPPNPLPALFGNLVPPPGTNVTPEVSQMMAAAMAAMAAAAGAVPPSGGPPPPPEGVPLITNNRTIHVSNIPDDKFNIMELASYFSRFGTVSNVKLSTQPTKKYAFVEFSTATEASSAFRNPEAVFGNRFIKVGWANNAAPTVSDGGVRGPRGRGRGNERGGRGRARGGSHISSGSDALSGATNAAVTAAIAAASSAAPVTSASQMETAQPPEVEKEPEETPEQVNARKRREILEMRESQKKQKVEAPPSEESATVTVAQQLAEKDRLMASIEAAKSSDEKTALMSRLRELMDSLSSAMDVEKDTRKAKVAARIEQKKKELVQLGFDPETGAPSRGGRGGWRGRGRGGRGGGSLDFRTRTVRIAPADKGQELLPEKELRARIFDIEELEREGSDWKVRFGSRRSAEFLHDRGNQALGGSYQMSWVEGRRGEPTGTSEATSPNGESKTIDKSSANSTGGPSTT